MTAAVAAGPRIGWQWPVVLLARRRADRRRGVPGHHELAARRAAAGRRPFRAQPLSRRLRLHLRLSQRDRVSRCVGRERPAGHAGARNAVVRADPGPGRGVGARRGRRGGAGRHAGRGRQPAVRPRHAVGRRLRLRHALYGRRRQRTHGGDPAGVLRRRVLRQPGRRPLGRHLEFSQHLARSHARLACRDRDAARPAGCHLAGATRMGT